MKIIRHHKGFKRTNKDEHGILYCADSKGRDWYEIAHNTPADEKALHIMVGAGGKVASLSEDITKLYPEGHDVISVEQPATVAMFDLITIKDGMISAVRDEAEEFQLAKANASRDTELRIAPLERAKRLGVATEEELAELEQLERYSVYLMRAKGPELIAMSDM